MNGEVYQVPVVGLLCILQVQLNNLIALGDGIGIVLQAFGGQLFEFCYENQETAEAHFVPAVHQELGDFGHGKTLTSETDYLAGLGDFQP